MKAPTSIRTLGILVATYALVVGALAWPLPRHLGTHLPDAHVSSRYDGLFIAWSLAHQSRALAVQPSEWPHGGVFHPARLALFHGEAAVGMLPYFAPPFLLSGNPVLAMNVAVLLCVTLTAVALHVVTALWTGSHAAGIVAACTALMTRWLLPGGIGAGPNYAAVQYVPAIVFLAALPRAGRTASAALVVLLFLQGLVSVYLAAAVLAPLAALGLLLTLRRDTRGHGLRVLGCAAAASVLLAPFFVGYALVWLDDPGLAAQTFFPAYRQEADLPWGPVSYWTPLGVPLASVALVVCTVAALLVRGRLAALPFRPAWGHAAFWTLAGVLAALPPTAHWGTRATTLPWAAVVDALGLYELIRVPDRLGVPAMIGFALLAGLAFATWQRRLATAPHARLGTAVACMAVVACMYGEFLRGPTLPVVGPRRSHTYFARLAQMPVRIPVPPQLYIRGAFAPFAYPLMDVSDVFLDEPVASALRSADAPVLELPVGESRLGSDPRGGAPDLQARAMVRSTLHHRPVLNGYSRYWPHGFADVVGWARRLPDAGAARELRQRTGLGFVLVNLDDLSPPERIRWDAIIDATGPAAFVPIAVGRRQALFRLVAPDAS